MFKSTLWLDQWYQHYCILSSWWLPEVESRYWPQWYVSQKFQKDTAPRKQTWQWNIHHLKMYPLGKNVIFQLVMFMLLFLRANPFFRVVTTEWRQPMQVESMMVASFAPFPTCCLYDWLQYSWGQVQKKNESEWRNIWEANYIQFVEDMTYMTVWCRNDVSKLRAAKIPSSLPLTWTMNHFDIVSFHVCIFLIFEIALQVQKRYTQLWSIFFRWEIT